MSDLKDFGIENPVKKADEPRYILLEKKAYGIWDNESNWWMDMAVDLANNDEAKNEMEIKLKELNK